MAKKTDLAFSFIGIYVSNFLTSTATVINNDDALVDITTEINALKVALKDAAKLPHSKAIKQAYELTLTTLADKVANGILPDYLIGGERRARVNELAGECLANILAEATAKRGKEEPEQPLPPVNEHLDVIVDNFGDHEPTEDVSADFAEPWDEDKELDDAIAQVNGDASQYQHSVAAAFGAPQPVTQADIATQVKAWQAMTPEQKTALKIELTDEDQALINDVARMETEMRQNLKTDEEQNITGRDETPAPSVDSVYAHFLALDDDDRSEFVTRVLQEDDVNIDERYMIINVTHYQKRAALKEFVEEKIYTNLNDQQAFVINLDV